MAMQADNAPTSAVGLTEDGAAERFQSLLDAEDGDQEGAAHSPQAETDAEDKSAEEEADADEGKPEGQEEEPPKITVKVNGEEIEVTLDELTRGYQRQADYTQKTQKLSQARQAQEAEFEAVKQERAKYAKLLTQLDARLQQSLPNEPNWDQLRDTDPVAFASQWAQHQRVQQERAVIRQEQERLAEQQANEQQQQLQSHIASEAAELVKAIPEWKDPAKARDEKRALLEYGLSLGFSEEDLNNVYDHRAVLALHKAWKYDQLLQRKAAAQVKIGGAKVLPPGTGNTPRKVTDLNKAKQKLAQTGSIDDAAAFFERTL